MQLKEISNKNKKWLVQRRARQTDLTSPSKRKNFFFCFWFCRCSRNRVGTCTPTSTAMFARRVLATRIRLAPLHTARALAAQATPGAARRAGSKPDAPLPNANSTKQSVSATSAQQGPEAPPPSSAPLNVGTVPEHVDDLPVNHETQQSGRGAFASPHPPFFRKPSVFFFFFFFFFF